MGHQAPLEVPVLSLRSLAAPAQEETCCKHPKFDLGSSNGLTDTSAVEEEISVQLCKSLLHHCAAFGTVRVIR